jgi:hypothetical protein
MDAKQLFEESEIKALVLALTEPKHLVAIHVVFARLVTLYVTYESGEDIQHHLDQLLWLSKELGEERCTALASISNQLLKKAEGA